MSSVSQSPSFDTPKLSNKQVMFKNSNKPTKRSGKSRYNKNNMLNCCNTTENSSSFSHNKNKNNNNNNKPLKVVHISNPMKFQATAAEFRALVQGLTGRDAVVVDDDDYLRGTHQTAAAATAAPGGDDDDNDGGGVHHYNHGYDNNNNNNNNNNSNDNDNDNDDKILLHHHHHHDQQGHQPQQVNLAACFGPTDHMSFDYFGAFNGDLVVTEDLQAFMGDDGYYYY